MEDISAWMMQLKIKMPKTDNHGLVLKITRLISLASVTFTDPCESATYAQLLREELPRRYRQLLDKIASQRRVYAEDVRALELMKKEYR